MILESIYSLAMIVFLLPSGALADLVGRKYVLAVGIAAEMLAVILFGIGVNFLDFAIAEALWGIGSGFILGVESAILYDTLKSIKREKDARKVFANGFFFNLFFLVIGSSLGGFIATIDFRLTFLLTVIPWIGALFVALWFTEPLAYKKKKLNFENYIKQISGALNEIRNKDVLYIIFASALIGGFGTVNYALMQPYLNIAGTPLGLFGVVFAIYSMAAALSSLFLNRFFEGWRAGKFIIYGGITLGLTYLLKAFVFHPVWSVVASIFTAVIMGILTPSFLALVHKSISSSKRATIYSIDIMLSNFTFAILGPVFGMIADYSLSSAFFTLAVSLIFTILILSSRMSVRCYTKRI
jgi:MFS family permease